MRVRDGNRGRVVRGDRNGRRVGPIVKDRDRAGGGVVVRDGRRRYTRTYIRDRGRRYAWGPGITFYFYDGHYYGDCDWLRRKARATGSSYWWARYRACRNWE
ncbi:MAG: hypothetical protein SFW09_15905 [Hyphomicrobiaceae bacterium]|nr:hypothetical protein [Hyphomicrobiaceae bacterium]